MKKVIELVGVKKLYRVGEVVTWGLRGVDLNVYEGEFISIMGPSGSGKTTLLNMIGLLDHPTEGKILIDSIDVSKLKSKQLARIRNMKIGFVFQSFNLINRLTVLENIELPLIVRKIPRKERIERVKKALLMAGGDLSWLPKHPNQLSGGQQQRVAIARALVGEPEIILADEPTGNLDRKSAKSVIKTFIDLNRKGQTIIMVTHDPEVANCTQKIYILRDGVIIREEKPVPDKCILQTVK
ncbi:ABC transporter ATP-binding protein [Staphylothermus hellenicus]|uniref:ABC transporter related protein n=1 Tax=Staphylothermus hellenicus (strain DSM 12710 / JCM 10830 / BK20S6-10-b1 / P8) TaxID=591019 RepID=D7D8M0_STAHD|nr:ABC transporter ATP-binding protein [Staphylothermus hellenicus]ADI32116.1 ABC transporter related protein [Staphylothermus hellenicus DSM 12710]